MMSCPAVVVVAKGMSVVVVLKVTASVENSSGSIGAVVVINVPSVEEVVVVVDGVVYIISLLPVELEATVVELGSVES